MDESERELQFVFCECVWEGVYGYVSGGWLCVWVAPLRVERLSEMTVINSFTLVPVDDIVNHIY